MSKVLLGDVAAERRETCKGSKVGYPTVGLEHLTPEEITLTSWDNSSDNTFTKMFHKGDMLFGRRRAYLKKAAVAPFDGICSGDITVITAKPNYLLPELLPFIIQNDTLFDFAVEKSAGSLSPRVKWEHLKNYEFSLPDMEKQHELSELLWAMDSTKKSYQRLVAATDELVKSQFIEWFGGNQCTKRRLDTVAEITSGLTKNSRRSSLPTKLPYLRVANVQFNKLDLMDVQKIGVEEKEIEKALLKKGDLLIVEGNGSPDQIGRVSMWDGSISPILHQNHIIKARFNSGAVLPDFAMYYYMTDEGRQQILDSAATTSGLYTLSLSKISRFMLPVPSIDKQQQFVEFAHQSDKSKFELEQALSELTATYKRIISQQFG